MTTVTVKKETPAYDMTVQRDVKLRTGLTLTVTNQTDKGVMFEFGGHEYHVDFAFCNEQYLPKN